MSRPRDDSFVNQILRSASTLAFCRLKSDNCLMITFCSAALVPSRSERGTVRSAELRFVLVLGLALCVVTSCPYILGHWKAHGGTQFTDVLGFEEDQNNYLAYERQSATGQWLFHNPMTAERHGNVFFNGEWLAIGKTAALLRTTVTCAGHIQRILMIVVLCLALYYLSASFLESVAVRRLALLTVSLGGGFGWLSALHKLHVALNPAYFPDFETGVLPFTWFLKVPHFLIAQTFVVLGLVFFVRAEQMGRLQYYIFAGVCYLAAGSSRPYDMLYVLLGTGLYACLLAWQEKGGQRRFFRRALPLIMCIPLLGYYVWLFRVHPVFKWWSKAGTLPSHPFALTLGFGLAALLLVPALWNARQRPLTDGARLMICCLAAGLLLTYSYKVFAFSYQFATDIYVPLAMVTAMGMETAIDEWRRSPSSRIAILGLVSFNSLTAAALVAQAIMLVGQGHFQTDASLISAFVWLDTHSFPGAVVLADYERANQIPRYTHNSVFCGYYNAVEFGSKSEALNRFFNTSTTNEFRRELIRQNRVSFVFLLAAEDRALANMSKAGFLREVFRNTTATIYEVTTTDR